MTAPDPNPAASSRQPVDRFRPDRQAVDWPERANVAARSVTGLFGRRLLFLPGTHLAAVQWPSKQLRNVFLPWHYWWQAHYVDCLVDAGRREFAQGAKFDGGRRPSAGRLASRLVTTIRLRNAFTFVNSYYDDMAWLALATLRLEGLAEATRRPGRRRNSRIREQLTLQFDSASTDDLGGGTFWSRARDFKNTPATAPVALYYARTGQQAKAQRLVDWLGTVLFDPARGLYLDGARLNAAGDVVVEDAIYTYNQGPVLGALLELGGEANLARAATVIDAAARHLTVPAQGLPEEGVPDQGVPDASGRLLRCDGTGDGGLFTGILCRYLALAARDARLPARTRATAAELVTATAEGLWSGRRAAAEAPAAANGWFFFSIHANQPAAATYPPGAAVELSTQLQAWMVLEAAAAITKPE